MLLGKLSLHYWRPEFTPEQAKTLYADYLDDLRPFAFRDIAHAIARWRQSDKTRFPNSGQLIALIRKPYAWESQSEHDKDLRDNAAKEIQEMTRKFERLQAPGARKQLTGAR